MTQGSASTRGSPTSAGRQREMRQTIVRTGMTLDRSTRRLRSSRFWLLVGVLAIACVAIPMTVALAATVLVNDLFIDNPAVFELDGNLAAGDSFAGGVTGTRDWANSSLTASGLGGDVITQTAPEPGGVPAPATFPYFFTDPATTTIYTTGGSKDILDVSNWK